MTNIYIFNLSLISNNFMILSPLFIKFLTPGLICELCNLFDDWLESTSPTNHSADYEIRELTQKLKIW